MKQYFPFTDYDFYAYLATGGALLFALDLTFNDAALTRQSSWTVVQVILVVGLAYITGQMGASVASLVLEHWIARRLLQPPMMIQLGLAAPRRREEVIGKYVIGRDYGPLPEGLRKAVFGHVEKTLGCPVNELERGADIFHVAFPVSKRSESTAARLQEFLKLYGFNRNLALVAFVAMLLFFGKALSTGHPIPFGVWGLAALAVAAISAARFLKFYAAYSMEMIRGYLVFRT